MKALQALSGVFLLLFFIWATIVLMPPYFNYYQFRDAIEAEARTATYSSKMTADDVRENIYKKAKQFEIPLQPEQIKVVKTRDGVTVDADYQIVVAFPVFPLKLDFSPGIKNSRPGNN
jgi:hypothetical protein